MASEGWSSLFQTAFRGSRNAMVLVDDERCIVDVNGAYMGADAARRRGSDTARAERPTPPEAASAERLNALAVGGTDS
ncbi:MAG: hypothetical protein ACRDPL_14770 [Propionibacteriaceae bacterium]